MPGHSRGRLVEVDQTIEIRSTRNGFERSPESRLCRVAHQPTLAQIEQGGIVTLVIGALLHADLPAPDEGAAAYFTTQKPPPLCKGVCSTDGADGHTELNRQLSLCREPSTGG
jgi:hypothetical protein